MFQGKLEFGPRALGSRSIIGDPRDPEMQKKMNLKIKFRESFRPFAPAVLEENFGDWFEFNENESFNFTNFSPYMLFVAKVKKDKHLKIIKKNKSQDNINQERSKIPAVTHVDFSARIQTVSKKNNPFFYELIEKFSELTSVTIVINTSFNIRGEPIVCSPDDALRCFMGTDMDFLVLENFIIDKNDIDQKFKKDYKNKFQLD